MLFEGSVCTSLLPTHWLAHLYGGHFLQGLQHTHKSLCVPPGLVVQAPNTLSLPETGRVHFAYFSDKCE